MKDLPYSKAKALRKFVKQSRSSEYKKLKKECDDLWKEIIFIKAGYKSEISQQEGKKIGGTHILQAHHIGRKPNNRLRYEIENGICLTMWEHKYGIHGDHEEEYRERIKKVKGKDIYDRMALLRNAKSADLRTVKLFLEQELRKLNE